MDAGDGIAGERLAQGLDDRDAARRGSLEIEADARRFGSLGKRHAVLGEERLVGGDDVLARRERRFDVESPAAAPVGGHADQLDEHLDGG